MELAKEEGPYSTFEGNGLNKQGIGLGLTICQNIVSLTYQQFSI